MNALHSGNEQDIESLYNRVAFCGALVTVLIAGTTSVFWVLSVFDSTDPYQHFVPMVDETALTFLIFGVALGFYRKCCYNRKLMFFNRAMLIQVLCIGLLCAIDYAENMPGDLVTF